MTILFAALSAVFGMLGLNGLPRPHHPVFNAPLSLLASRNRFFLCLQARDPLFDEVESRSVPGGVSTEVHLCGPVLIDSMGTDASEGRTTPG